MDRPEAQPDTPPDDLGGGPGPWDQGLYPTGPGHRSGFVGLVGKPNVGKSTILNFYLGEKLAIVTPRPQTTRQRIHGVLTRPDVQAIFVDTPGLHEPRNVLGRYMQEVTKAVLEDVDILVAVVDARSGLRIDDERLFDRLRQVRRTGVRATTMLAAINKIDLVQKARALPLIEACAKTGLFAECVPVSAKTGLQMDVLLRCIIQALPEGPEWYGPQDRTDQSREQRIRELIREQVLLATHEEVPGAVAVELTSLETKPRVTVVQATIYVERPGQKAIIIGREGRLLKEIGQAARRELEAFLGNKVYLGLWVKVAEHWRGNERLLRELGYG
jgi:GTP-binding protein Era